MRDVANKLALNTAGIPNLKQVLVATEYGLFDYMAQQAAGQVTLTASATDQLKKAQVLKVLHPINGQPLVTES